MFFQKELEGKLQLSPSFPFYSHCFIFTCPPPAFAEAKCSTDKNLLILSSRRGRRKQGSQGGSRMLGVQIKEDLIFHTTFFPGQTFFLGTLAEGEMFWHSPIHQPSPQRASQCSRSSSGYLLYTSKGKEVPFLPSLPHTVACIGLLGIASHLLSFQSVGHRETISHGTVT